MPQVFHPATNAFARMSIVAVVLLVLSGGWLGTEIVRSAYLTRAHDVRDQPVPFSHRHHVYEEGLDCRYCHKDVENSSFAGMPATEVCMGCHSQIWADSPMLAQVRESNQTLKPIAWTRVHDLPDFVYFNHSIHVAKGIGCSQCHGRVDQMPLMWREATLTMEWCLNCHRHPETEIRPREDVFAITSSESLDMSQRQQFVKEYEIDSAIKLTNCTICHR